MNVRRYGQCLKCHKYRELRVSWNDTMSEIISVCDQCFHCPLDEEAFDMIFEKAGVPGPARSMRTAQSMVEGQRKRMAGRMFTLERIFPEED